MKYLYLLIYFLLFPWEVAVGQNISYQEVTYSNTPYPLKGYLCRPAGSGPFPVVIFNHGGKGDIIGGDVKGVCKALAQAGYVGFSPLRRQEPSMPGQIEDIKAALEYVKKLEGVNSNKIGMIGFSRGGLMTFISGTKYPELKALVIMAAAPPPAGRNFEGASQISAPVLLLVAKNDTVHQGVDHVSNIKRIEGALKGANKNVQLIVYPPYGSDGHKMFFEVGNYWKDVTTFLQKYL